jgi:serine/threonine protein kinase
MSSEHIYALPTGHRIRQYELKRLLGHGNFGLTYLAYNKKLECYVAIKEMLPFDFAVRARDGITVVAKSPGQEAALAWARERFYDEAKTLAKLQHPSILPVFDYFEDNGTAYLISPFIEGETLEDWFAKRGTPSEGELCAILRTLLNALNIVHHSVPNQIVLHRDIKPENILMERKSGVPVLIDFGNARVASGLKTSNLSAILTPGYAPFEQYQTDGKQGPWTDLYALGAVLYRAVTGKVPPWSTDRQGDDTIVRLAHNPSIKGYSPSFLTMIDKALRLRREERWQSCAEWLTALDRLTPPPSTPKTKPRFGFAITAVASVVIVGGGLAYLLKLPPEPPRPAIGAPLIAIEQPAGFALSHGQAVVDFGRPSINATVPKTFVIKNIGQVELSGLLITKDGSNDFSIAPPLNTTSVAAGKSTEFAVNFTPRESGSQKATLHVTSNSSEGRSPFDINLTGGGVGTPDISIEQDGKVLADNSSALNFGSSNVGSASELKFTIKSIGTADLAGLAANVDGAAAKDYTVSALSSGTIAPGRTAAFSVIFKPSASGERSAILRLASNASGAKNPFDLSFNGSGQMPPPPPPSPEPPKQAAVAGNGPIENSIGMTFVPVKITDVGSDGRTLLFSIWETRVSDFGQWKSAYLKADHAKDAVNGVSPADAKGFCEWLSAKEGRTYRLPTDHEWSCAAGLSEKSVTPWRKKNQENLKVFPWTGTGAPSPLEHGNYSTHILKTGQRREPKLVVGLYKANGFGLFDIGGNVAELCIDQNSSDAVFLLRGGSWATAPMEQSLDSGSTTFFEEHKFDYFYSSRREEFGVPESDEIGFRCVLEP